MLVENSGGGNGGEGKGSNTGGNGSKTNGMTKTSGGTKASAGSKSSSSSKAAPTTPTKSASSGLDAQLMYTPPHVLIRSISSLSQHSLRPSTPEHDQVSCHMNEQIIFLLVFLILFEIHFIQLHGKIRTLWCLQYISNSLNQYLITV